MKNKLLIVLYLCLIGVILQACGAYTGRAPITNVAEETNKVIYKDFSSKIDFAVVKYKHSKLEGGQLKIQVKIENWSDDDVWCDVQTIFKDKSGFEVEQTNFEPILFKRRQITHYQNNSISTDAEDFNVIIRRN